MPLFGCLAATYSLHVKIIIQRRMWEKDQIGECNDRRNTLQSFWRFYVSVLVGAASLSTTFCPKEIEIEITSKWQLSSSIFSFFPFFSKNFMHNFELTILWMWKRFNRHRTKYDHGAAEKCRRLVFNWKRLWSTWVESLFQSLPTKN